MANIGRNSRLGHDVQLTREEHDRYFSLLPEDLKRYMKFEMVRDGDPRGIYHMYLKYGPATREILLLATQMETAKVYSPDHPYALWEEKFIARANEVLRAHATHKV